MSNRTGPVYIVDDDVSVREAVGSLVRSAGWPVQGFASAQEFLASRGADEGGCLVLDLKLPGVTGLDLQEKLTKVGADLPIIFLTGHADIPASVRAIKAGAVDFLTKPFEEQALLDAIEQGMARSRQARTRRPNGAPGEFADIIGSSAGLRAVLDKVAVVAPTDSTVLILGETGTGKEIIARAIHKRSRRAAQRFVNVNCAAIPPTLVASELFGHEKGAFTGALQRHLGRFEQAEGGTLFLDEIGDLPAETQITLLRVLQEREFERVGGRQAIRADVRVIAATNQDLEQAVQEGTFRADLYYRLHVFPIVLPPLRERRGDIPALVEHFIGKLSAKLGKQIDAVAPAVLDALCACPWPGNVRELENVIERAVIMSPGPTLQPGEWLPQAKAASPNSSAPPTNGSIQTLAASEREQILRALDATGWRGVLARPETDHARRADEGARDHSTPHAHTNRLLKKSHLRTHCRDTPLSRHPSDGDPARLAPHPHMQVVTPADLRELCHERPSAVVLAYVCRYWLQVTE
ncbi:MAG TPA: sigma-54 dependent transcriptional regulator, partial [Anaeromyxobacteraceae bacterium]|nr:sigma-54 dependent transcriptional regulator [Anaeromyxobacteraceae bacterium]